MVPLPRNAEKMDQKPGDYRDDIAAQLKAIGARLDFIFVTLKNGVEAIKARMYGTPLWCSNQVSVNAKTCDHSSNIDKDRFLDVQLKIENRFEHVVGGQLEVGDGIQLEIEDPKQTQNHVKGLPTKLPSDGPAFMISWANEKEKWAEMDEWKDLDMLKMGKGDYVSSHRVWASPLADKKVVVYWSDLNSTTFVKARSVG